MKLLRNSTLLATTILCCLFAPTAQAKDYDISITDSGFSPDYLEVTVGDRVFWWNDDYIYYDYHSTVSYSYPWNSGPIDVGYGVYLVTDHTGTFDYLDDYGYSGSGTLVIKPSGPPPPPPPTVIPAPNRVDMVYDQGRDILYIASGSAVLRYQLGSASFLDPFQLSGSLMGIDLSPDGNLLLVADSTASSTNVWVHQVDLTTGQDKEVFFPIAFGETGTFAVAFGGDGAALISSRFGGSGWVPLRRYDPATGKVTVVASVRQDSMVSSSGDGTTIIIAESNISNGAMDLYDVASRTITRTGGTGHFNYECAASKEGALFALPTYYGTSVYDRSFTQVTNIGVYAGAQPIGAAFHPAADAVFFPFSGTTYVEAYSTTDWSLLAQYDFGTSFTSPGNHAFGNGRIRLSPDGQTIFVTVSGGVGYVRHGLSLSLTHRLVVAGNPAAYGTPSPMSYGTYWLADGTSITLSVPAWVESNGAEFICTGWTGTGSAAGTNTTTETTFTLTANSILTWNWCPLKLDQTIQAAPSATQVTLRWPSVEGQTYDVLGATNLNAGFQPVIQNLPATPPTNVYQISVGPARAGFYRVQAH